MTPPEYPQTHNLIATSYDMLLGITCLLRAVDVPFVIHGDIREYRIEVTINDPDGRRGLGMVLGAVNLLQPAGLVRTLPELDGKFLGHIYRARDGRPEDPSGWMVFVARDNALLDTLAFYQERSRELGVGEEQIAAMDRVIARVKAWRETHPEECKLPDAEPGECP